MGKAYPGDVLKHITIAMTDDLRDFLWERQIIPKPWERETLKPVKTLLVPPSLQVEPYTRHVFRRMDQTLVLTSARHMSYTHSPLHLSRMGAFCSIAIGVSEMGASHPIERTSSHPFSYDAYYSTLVAKMGAGTNRAFAPYKARPPEITIGNDVWIGAEAVLKGGITIGDGAVIASRAMVTKDVPPYAIVGGVPAKVIRHRFAPELCERLAATRWWDYALTDLVRFSMEDPEDFCTRFEAALPDLEPRQVEEVTARMLQDLGAAG